MKKVLSIFLLIAIVLSFAACGKKQTNNETQVDSTPVTTRVATLKGPTGMGMAKLMADDKAAETHKYEFTLSAAPEDVKAGILSGNFDIAAIPTNLAAVLYNKAGADISVLAVNTLGVLYVLENGNTINALSDLVGKKVYATGQGSTPEYIFNYILEKNGIDVEKDVEVEYLTEHSELATQMTAGSVQIGVLPEPNVTASIVGSQTKELRVALDLTKEWEKAAPGTTVMQGCIVVNNSFLKEHPEAVKEFMEEYKKSVDFVNTNIPEAAQLCEEAGIVPKAMIAQKAIPNCNITFVTGEELKTGLNAFFKVLFDANPASVGGKLPDDAFYYNAK
ncbi:MAG: ABC transporter substrate-binding protein [Clostridia bacterium]|nr:ABC transporter substrate-binding protein [Clostridia bacterium]